jgi:predicted Fe-Mo cluster-binding NifX family protein
MKVAIPSKGESLSAEVERQFGRCENFLIVDTETLELRAVSNEAKEQAGGAGIAAAQRVIDEGAEAVLAGKVGPNASDVLNEAGIPLYVDVSGTVKNALELLESECLELSTVVSEANSKVPEHSSGVSGLAPGDPGQSPDDSAPVHLGTRKDCEWGRGQGRGQGRGRRGRRGRRIRSRQRRHHLLG